jgi:nucleoside-diphosphate-sugar epimerase
VTAAPRILVTGGRGFIGRRCLQRLADAGHEIVAVSRAIDGVRHSGITWQRADLLERGAAERLIESVRPTHLLHLSWYTKSPDYWSSPLNDDWARVSIDLVRAFIAAGGRRIVAAGTCAEYAWLGEPCVETFTPLRPATRYGEMKLRALRAIEVLARHGGISLAWLRPFFAYGPGEEGSKLLSSNVERIRTGELVSLVQPGRRLDFIHVDDIAQAFVGLVACTAGGQFNVGTGRGTTIREAVEALGVALGITPRIECLDGDAQPDVIAEVGRLSSVLPWQPRTVMEGVRSIANGGAN